jgi:hypothetical protein
LRHRAAARSARRTAQGPWHLGGVPSLSGHPTGSRPALLPLAASTLIIQRGYRHRIVYLDEVTAALASRWLRYRHHRWPYSRNPHLLVSQQTAADTSPVGPTMIGAMFEPLGVRQDRLRQDRILDFTDRLLACS